MIQGRLHLLPHCWPCASSTFPTLTVPSPNAPPFFAWAFSFVCSVPSSALPILPFLPSQSASLPLLLPPLLSSWPSRLPSLPSQHLFWPWSLPFGLLALLLRLVNNNLVLFSWRLHSSWRFLLSICLVWCVVKKDFSYGIVAKLLPTS